MMSRPEPQAGLHGLRLPVATLALLALAFALYVRAEKRIDRAYDQRQVALGLLDQLRQSSDELTRMARTYVATGDPSCQQHYRSILAIRSGQSPAPATDAYTSWDLVMSGAQAPPSGGGPALALLERMRQAGITPGELRALASAQAQSEALTRIEWEAMARVATGSQTTPMAQAQATRLLHDENYHQAKAAIIQPILETYRAVERRTAAEIAATKREAWTLLTLFIAGALGGLFILWRAYRRSLRILTRQHQAEARLLASEQNLAVTLNSIGDAVIATDVGGLITRMNPTAERLTGWPLAEALGQPLEAVFRILDTKTRAAVVNPVQRVLEEGKVVGLSSHTALLSRNDAEYQIADSAAPIRDLAGQIIGVVLVFSDISEQYRVEQALTRATDLLNRTSEIAKIGGWELDLATQQLAGSWTWPPSS